MQRRSVLAAAGLGLALASGARPAAAQAQPFEDALRKLTGGATPREGRITLRAPAIAENGNAVPVSVAVESPMSAADHVRAIHILAEKNPAPEVASFRLTPAMGRAAAETRIRLGETQDVIALAQMSDGSFVMARAEVKVTIGGCGG
jgi:sulfur-oxidizing protein SoxY